MTASSSTHKNTLHSLLKTHFGYDTFRPQQQEIIETVMLGDDVLTIMPTGGGKSLCFQLPAMAMEGTAIVISPLIALMKDQVDALKSNGIKAAFYNSTQPQEEQEFVLNELVIGAIKLLYVAPESLWLLHAHLKAIKLSLIAIDEAHCISSWGHDFRPAYTKLGRLKDEFPGIPVMALTATADKATQDDIVKQLRMSSSEIFISSFDRPNLFLEVRPGQSRIAQILKFLKSQDKTSGIIYCLSRKGTEKLAEKIRNEGYLAEAYHAGLSSEKRSKIQEDFINDRTPIIVATIAFGMGIDKSNVRWVVHYNMPKNIEGYYQEIGRAGRDGLPSKTLLFYSFADVIQLQRFIKEAANREYQEAKLERMQQYSEALSCRRKALLGYFGEQLSKDCGNCDICKSPPVLFDGTLIAQKICSAVVRLKEQEALGMVIDVLRGSKNAQVYDKGYQLLKTFGVAKEISWKDLQQYIIQLLNQGVLEVRFHEHGRLLLTNIAKEILFEKRTVRLANLVQPKLEQPKERIAKKGNALFEKLRSLRSKIAAEMGVPAYVIFSDATLQEMEEKLPKNHLEFSEIGGVGQAKLDKYADLFLRVIARHTDSLSNKEKRKTHERSYDMYIDDGMSVLEISEERGITINTVYGHLLKMHSQGTSIDLHQFISNEEIAKVKKAKEALGSPESVKVFYDYFEGKIPYYKINFGLYLSKKASL